MKKVYLVRNMYDGSVYKVCETEEIAKHESSKLEFSTYISKFTLIDRIEK